MDAQAHELTSSALIGLLVRRGRSLPQALAALGAPTSVTLEQLNSLIDYFQLPQDTVAAQLREVCGNPPTDIPSVAI